MRPAQTKSTRRWYLLRSTLPLVHLLRLLRLFSDQPEVIGKSHAPILLLRLPKTEPRDGRLSFFLCQGDVTANKWIGLFAEERSLLRARSFRPSQGRQVSLAPAVHGRRAGFEGLIFSPSARELREGGQRMRIPDPTNSTASHLKPRGLRRRFSSQRR